MYTNQPKTLAAALERITLVSEMNSHSVVCPHTIVTIRSLTHGRTSEIGSPQQLRDDPLWFTPVMLESAVNKCLRDHLDRLW